MTRLLPVLALLFGLAGCVYRLQAPRPPAGGVHITVVNEGTRLVATQSLLHRAVADAVVRELGWPVRPEGRARLRLVLHEEAIEDSGADGDGITVAWRVELRCSASWFGHGRHAASDFEAVGSYTSLDREAQALEAACETLADSVVDWLANQATP
ncbi:MAG: hypothetical protein ACOCXJ_00875 [Planctomycetota bacterium]